VRAGFQSARPWGRSGADGRPQHLAERLGFGAGRRTL
jgi:hypothetical protein